MTLVVSTKVFHAACILLNDDMYNMLLMHACLVLWWLAAALACQMHGKLQLIERYNTTLTLSFTPAHPTPPPPSPTIGAIQPFAATI